jgi:hypothetical protein
LKELDELYKDYRHPNLEIGKMLTTKTVEQIKNKGKRLKIRCPGDRGRVRSR